MKSSSKYKQLFFVIAIAIISYSCHNTNDKTARLEQEKKVMSSPQNDESSLEEGTMYSDSMINAIISQQKNRNQKIKLDTNLILNQFKCTNRLGVKEIEFKADAPERFSSSLHEISKKEQLLLNSTHCFGMLNEDENYKLLVLFNNSNESHFSSSFQLVSILKGTHKIEKLILFQEYRNEMGDEIILSKIDSSFNIIRTITHNFRYIHGIGNVDSTNTLVEKYYVDENGYIKPT